MQHLKSAGKLAAIYLLRGLMRVLHIFPLRRGRIIFFSYHGTQYSCSPKYISEYLEKNYPGQFEIIWAFKHPKNFTELQCRGIKTVGYQSLQRLFYEATAQVSINNIGSFSWLPLRKGQLHINTWHGGGCYKKVSLGESRNDVIMKKTLLMTAQETSYMLSSSRYSTENVIVHDFGYHGEVLNSGLPRNDILVHGDRASIQEKVRAHFGISADTKLLLYAPTWRYDQSAEIVLPDFDQLRSACEQRFGGNWTVLLRAHSWMLYQVQGHNFLDATKYPDMQELLVACDMLLSDYSSCIWDYSLTYRPCLLFTPDLDQYTAERGFDVDIFDWGFPVCRTSGELADTILHFDDEQFHHRMEKHHRDLGSFDTGTACAQVGSLIYNFCHGAEKKEGH